MEQDISYTHPIQKQKRRLSRKKLLALIPIILMFSYLLAAWNPAEDIDTDPYTGIPEEKITVNDYNFWILEDDTYGTFFTTGGREIPIAFRLDPREAAKIPLEEEVVPEVLSASKIYLTFNPNKGELSKIAVASAELSRVLAVFNTQIKGAYTEDTNPINPNIPLKTCEDATKTTKVIYMQLGEETGIFLKDNCIYMSGETEDDLILTADKLSYNLLGFKI